MKIGYARVSTTGQNLDMQLDSLRKASCEKIFTEKESGVKDRPVLNELLSYIRQGDELVVYKLDRLGRSLKELLNIASISFAYSTRSSSMFFLRFFVSPFSIILSYPFCTIRMDHSNQ